MLGGNLEGERIRLRAPALEDLPTFTRWFADPEVTRYLFRRYPPSAAQEVGWFEGMATSEKDLVWAVVLQDGDLVIGVIGLHRINWQHRHAWIEIVIGERPAWGKGYATEAMRLGTDHAFHELGLAATRSSPESGMTNGSARSSDWTCPPGAARADIARPLVRFQSARLPCAGRLPVGRPRDPGHLEGAGGRAADGEPHTGERAHRGEDRRSTRGAPPRSRR